MTPYEFLEKKGIRKPFQEGRYHSVRIGELAEWLNEFMHINKDHIIREISKGIIENIKAENNLN